MLPVSAQAQGICDRTPQVQSAILGQISTVTDCALVTTAQLNALDGTLDLSNSVPALTSLMSGDFDDLTKLEILQLGGNSIESLPLSVFDDLTSLTELHLNGNNIASLREDVFAGVANLTELDLRGNEIVSLPDAVFSVLTSLTALRLQNNLLTSLPAGVFGGLTSLTALRLQNNFLASLPEDTFDDLTELTELNLSNNLLTSLPEGAFDGLTKLSDLNLSNNPSATNPVAFSIPYKLVRTDTGGNTARPATIQVRLPLYVPSRVRSQTVTLSALGGTLAIKGGGGGGTSVMVGLDTDVAVIATGNVAVIVSATAPSRQTAANGMVAGDAENLELDLNAPPTGAPTITRTDAGTPIAGQTLTAATEGTLDDPNGVPNPFEATYQWQSSATSNFSGTPAILQDSLSSTYKLTTNDAGRYVRVRVSFTDGATNPEIATSAPIRIAITDLCNRTPRVRTAILAKISSVNDCFVVTTAQLNALDGTLDLSNRVPALTSLMPNDFDDLENLTELVLTDNSITSLPEDVFDSLTRLTELYLNGNSITSLTGDPFAGLANLTYLDLRNNRITSLPENVFDSLINLTTLRLQTNSIESLPENVFNGLTNLTSLRLQTNSIESLPENVFNGLTGLLDLNLSDNRLTSLPRGVFDGLTGLADLDLSNNRLTPLTEDPFDGLAGLTYLNLSNNRLTSLTEGVFDGLTRLISLNLSDNLLTSLTEGVFDSLTSLRTLRLDNNPSAANPIALPIPYELERTDTGGNTARPATIRVLLPLYVPDSLRSRKVTLSALGGTLAIGGSPAGASVMVGLDTDVAVIATGSATVTVSATEPTQTTVNGMVVGDAENLALDLNAPPTGTPAITRTDAGTPIAGQTLRATEGTLDDPNGVPNPFVATYQWQSSNTSNFSGTPAILQDSMSSTYELTTNEAGRYVRVRVSFTDGATNLESGTSAPIRIAATDLCDRTPQVRDKILSKLSGVNDCFAVTTTQLGGLAGTLNLSNSRLTELMPGDFAGLTRLTELVLTNNDLTSLSEDVFDGLTGLTKLVLNGNTLLTSVSEDIFDGLISLTELDLRGNSITSLPEEVFNGLTNLSILLLQNNSLTSLPDDVFDGLTNLSILKLQRNNIASLPKDVFDRLTRLGDLDLSNNSITNRGLPDDVFDGLTSLSILLLLGNPGAPFSIPYDLVRTNVGTASPATIQVRLPSYVPASLRPLTVSLSAMGGTLAMTAGAPTTDTIMVALDTDVMVAATDDPAVIVSAARPSNQDPNGVNGMVVGDARVTVIGNVLPTGTPTISGTPAVGQELTARADSIVDGNGLGTFSYQWQRSTDSSVAFTNPISIIGATRNTYVLDDADANHYIRVVVSFIDDLGTQERVASTPTTLIPPRDNSPATGELEITGTPIVPQTLSAVTDAIRDADNPPNTNIAFSYQWQRSDDEAFDNPIDISNTNRNTYVLTGDDSGQYIRVRVTFTDGATNTEVVFSRPTDRIAGGTNLCDRTEQVQTAILGKITGVDDCSLVTTTQLNELSGALNLSNHSLSSGDFVGLRDITTLTIAPDISDSADNSLTTLPSGIFDGLSSLTTLSISNINTLTTIASGAFTGLTSLTSLTLSDNSMLATIDSGDSGTFTGLMRLQTLVLSGNSTLATIAAGAFTSLTSLQTLVLSGNSIASLPNGVFTPLALTLTRLDLQDNNLSIFPTDALTVLTLLGTSGGTFNIENNPNTGSPAFTIPYELERTDGDTGSPATIQVHLPAYMPSSLRALPATLSATNAVLDPTTVDLDTNVTVTGIENLVVFVSATPPIHTAVRGMQIGTPEAFRAIDGNTPAMGAPTISRDPAMLQQLIASVEGNVITDADGLADPLMPTGYQWQRSNTSDFSGDAPEDVMGATNPTYTLTNADLGKYLRVLVSFNDERDFSEVLPSVPTAQIKTIHNQLATGAPTISRDPAMPQKLRASVDVEGNAIADEDGLPEDINGYTYQWQRNESPDFTDTPEDITGETSASYTLTSADDGMYVRVVVSFNDGRGTEEVRPSVPILINSPATGTVSISGITTVPNMLTAVTNNIVDENSLGAFSYQWHRGDTSDFIPDNDATAIRDPVTNALAIGDAYTLTDADAGKYIRVVVSFTDGSRFSERLTSEPTEQVNAPAKGAPAIAGEIQVGEELTASVGTITDDNGPTPVVTASYQWQRSDNADFTASGINVTDLATGPTYTLADTDEGKYIRVVASFTDDDNFPESRAFAPADPVAPRINNPAQGLPTITGLINDDLPTVSEELTAVTDGISDDDGPVNIVFSYQWHRGTASDFAPDGANTAIVDPVTSLPATDKAYALTDADAGQYIRVVVSFTDTHGTVERLTSEPTKQVNAPAKGAPAISGTIQVGEELTASVGTITDANGPNPVVPASYQWQRSDNADFTASGTNVTDLATGPTYTLADTDEGKYIRVVASFTDDDNFPESRAFAPADPVAPRINNPAQGLPTITGLINDDLPTVSEELTAVTTSISDDDGPANVDIDFMYQWERSDDNAFGSSAPIDSATDVAYTLTDDDAGKYIRVVVSFTDTHGTVERLTSEPTKQVNAPAKGAPAIAGTIRVGEELTASVGTITDANGPNPVVPASYQWQRSDNADFTASGINVTDLATGATYTLADADVGKYIRVVASFTDDDNFPESRAFAPADPVTPRINNPAQGLPTITGLINDDLPTVSEELTAVTDGISDDDGPANVDIDFMYQWERSDDNAFGSSAPIDSATDVAYTLTDDDAGKYIRVVASFTDTHGTVERLTSEPTKQVNAPAKGAPAIAGEIQVGEELTASVGTITDDNGPTPVVTASYQWQRSDTTDFSATGINVTDLATGPTYTLADTDDGKYIRVVASFTDDDNFPESRAFAPADPVASRINNPAQGLPTITGLINDDLPTVPEKLTAVTDGISDDDGPANVDIDFMYQWERSDDNAFGSSAPIDSATDVAYTLTDDDAGQYIRVVASFTDTHGTVERLTSEPTKQVNAPAKGTPAISGTIQVGEELTASVGTITDANGPNPVVPASYQWQRSDNADFTASGINVTDLATGATYTLADADVGKYIRVVASFTDDDNFPESRAFAPADPVASRINNPAQGLPTITGLINDDLPTVSEELTAVTTAITDADGPANNDIVFSYQWHRGDTADFIPDDDTTAIKDPVTNALAIGDTYTLTDADAGKYIRVVVSFTDGSRFSERLTSEPTEQVNAPAKGAPAIAGEIQVGEELTASVGTITDDNGPTPVVTASYQWQRSDNADFTASGINVTDLATGPTYTLADTDEGKYIRVVASFTDDDNFPESRAFAPADPVAPRINNPAQGLPTITGLINDDLPTVSEELTAVTDGISDDDGPVNIVFSYQWHRGTASDFAPDGANTAIVDPVTSLPATDKAYALTDADAGQYIRVVVSFTDTHGTVERLTSEPTKQVNAPAKGAPAISGTIQVGEELTASVGTITDANGPNPVVPASYQWQRSDNADFTASGTNVTDLATGPTYTLADTDEGKYIRVVASFTDDDNFPESRAFAPADPVAPRINNPAQGLPTITGLINDDLPTVSEELTAVTTSISDDDGPANVDIDFMYQWERSDDNAFGSSAPIDSATDVAYTLTDDDAGKYIRVVVSFTDTHGTVERLTSEPTKQVNAPAKGAPAIAGTIRVGEELTASVGTITDANGPNPVVPASYQWQRSDNADFTASGINVTDLATGATYTLADADVGKYIRVVASFTDDDNFPESRAFAPADPVASRINNPAQGLPTITGLINDDLPTVSEELTAVTDGISDDDGPANVDIDFMYQWERSDDNAFGSSAPIDSATDVAYTLTDDDAGKYIRVVASFTDTHGTVERLTSEPTKQVNAPAKGAPAIAGEIQVGEELTASVGTITDDNGPTPVVTASYQWQRSDTTDFSATGINVTDLATGPTYTLADTDDGKYIRVVASFTDDDNFPESRAFAPADPVASRINNPAQGLPTITGLINDDLPTVPEKLTAVTDGISDDDGPANVDIDFMYQWERSDDNAFGSSAPIDSATDVAYTLTDDDAGQYIRVVASFTDTHGTVERLTSEPTKQVNAPAKGTPAISGTIQVGEELTASVGTITDANGPNPVVPASYQWQRSDNADFTASGINVTDLATGATYTLADADVGKYIRVVASFTDDDNFPESRAFAPADPVASRINNPAQGLPTITGLINDDLPTVSEELTAVTTAITDADGPANNDIVFSYQWHRGDTADFIPDDDTTAIKDPVTNALAIGDTYTLTNDDAGTYIRVVVSFTDTHGTVERLTSEPTKQVNAPAKGAPAIAGEIRVGEELTASVGTITDANGPNPVVPASYQWQRSDTTDFTATGTNVTDLATGATYTLADTDEGKYIRVVASFNDDDNFPESRTSDTAGPVAPRINNPAQGLPTITGLTDDDLPTVSETLTAVTTSISDDDGPVNIVFSYQWHRGTASDFAPDGANTAIVDPVTSLPATDKAYALTDADAGQFILVVVSFTDTHGTVERLTSEPTKQVNAPAKGAPAISGTIQVGEELTASVGTITDANGPNPVVTASYQWQRSDTTDFSATGINVTDLATGPTYTLADTDEGKYIRVVASFTDDDNFPESRAFAPADPVASRINNPAQGLPTITGLINDDLPTVPEKLTAVTDGISDDDGPANVDIDFMYQWERSDDNAFGSSAPIDSATDVAYTLTDDDAGQYIRVVASFTDGLGNEEALTSLPTAQIARRITTQPNTPATGTLTISGTTTVPNRLTTVTDDIADDDVLGTFSYQWQRSDDTNFGSPTDIGNNDAQYTLGNLDAGQYIRVVVSFTDGASNAEMVFSRPTARVAGGANLCGRTTQVQTAILALLGVGDCVPVTIAQLNDIDDPLDLSNSPALESLERGDFAGLSALTTLTINNISTLTTIESGTFTGLTSLQTLSLVGNSIASLPGNVFASLTSLNSLILSDTSITSLSARIFANLTGLQSLFLNNNNITKLPPGIFARLTSLQTLALNGNSIASLPNGVFTPLAGTLTRLELQDNNLRAFPTDALSVLTQLNAVGAHGLRIGGSNPGSPFPIPYEIVRTNGGSSSPATLVLRLPSYVADSHRTHTATLSLTGSGNLSKTSVTAGVSFMVTQTGDEDVLVVAEPSSGGPIARGMMLAAAEPLRLFNSAATGEPAIAGAAILGQRLTVNTSRIADEDGLGDFSYQWYRGREGFTHGEQTRIDGATASEYSLTDDDVDAHVLVVVSFTDGAGAIESLASGTTAQVGDALFTTQTMSAVEAIADLSTATVFTSAVSNFLDSPSAGLSIDGLSAESRWQSVLRALVPTGDSSGRCQPSESDRYEKLLSSSTSSSSPCSSLDQDELGRRLRQATEVGDVALALLNPQSGIDLWLHATSFEVSGSPRINNSNLNYDGDGLLAYIGVALRGSKRFRYGFTFGISESSVDLALASGGISNDNVSRNLMFGSGFIDYRLGDRAQYSLRVVLGQGSGDADITVVDDNNGYVRRGTTGADLSFATLSFGREFDLDDNWQLVSSASWATSRGETDAVTLTGDGEDVQAESGSSSATELKLALDATLILGNNHYLTFGGALRRSTGDLGNSGGADLITRYQGGRFNVHIQKQIIGRKNEIDTYSLEYALMRPKVEKRNRFGLTLGTDYNRSSSYFEPLGEVRHGPLSLGYFGRFSYGFGKENTAGSGSLDTRLQLNQDGEVGTDLNLNIRF